MVAKAALIRRNICLHLYRTFPVIQDGMEPFINGSCYSELCGMTAAGKRHADVSVRDSSDDDTENLKFTSARSRVALAKFASLLMKCRLGATLCKMAKDDHLNPKFLSLGHKDTGLINKHITDINDLYKIDFQPTISAPVSPVTAVTHTMGTSEADGVTVQLTSEKLTKYPVRRGGGSS